MLWAERVVKPNIPINKEARGVHIATIKRRVSGNLEKQFMK
jgi:hypothetical protein